MKQQFATIALLGTLALLPARAQFFAGQGQNNRTGFTVSSTDILEGLTPILEGGSVAAEEGVTTSNLAVLSDGRFGSPTVDPSTPNDVVAIHNGTVLTYDLTAADPGGFYINEINTYTGWRDPGRDAQEFTIRVAPMSDPTSFRDAGTVSYNPSPAPSPSDNGMFLADISAAPAVPIAKIQFAFPTTENGYVGYREFDVIGNAAVPEPASALLLVGAAGCMAIWRPRVSDHRSPFTIK